MATSWYLRQAGKVVGPYSSSQLKQMADQIQQLQRSLLDLLDGLKAELLGGKVSAERLQMMMGLLAEAEAAGRVAAGRLPRGSAVGLGVATAEVASLIFLAEWGDRSMLATIALAAAQGPVGVAAGAAAGHAVATALAVLGGSLVSGWLSEKVIGVTGGVLFLVFAAATWAGFM